MRLEAEQLKKFLLDSGLVKEGQIDEAEKISRQTRQKLADVLVFQQIISQEELAKLQAYILGIPFVNLEKEKIDPEVLKIIPESLARTHNIVAFRKKGKELEVAMLDPDDLRTIEFIKKKSDLKILSRLTSIESVKAVLLQYRQSLEAEFGEIIKKETVQAGKASLAQAGQPEAELRPAGKELEEAAQGLPIIKIVDTLLRHAILQRASDIHIEPLEKEVLVRYRVDGILREAMLLPRSVLPGIVARIKVLSNLKLDEHRLPQDGRFKIETDDFRYSVRVSVLPVFDGEKIVMRLLSETSQALSLEELGLTGQALEIIRDNLRKPVGLILVTGPTGSGKTTTLYSMMEILNVPGVNISTVEDPVEYRMPRINQTQVNPKVGLTFASGLRSLVRQDPDILMVGEIRDNETAGLAINAALTGHLVLSTLHTNSAAGAIPRLLDMRVEPFLLSSTLNAVIAQRLVRRLDENRLSYSLKPAEIKDLAKYCQPEKILQVLKEERIVPAGAGWEAAKFFRPKPSKENPDGFRGRLGIYEVLPISSAVKDLIVKRATSDQIQQQAQKEGLLTMVEDGFVKAARGLTSIEEVLRVIIE
jgi:type IV pilus assembly protein PilB